MTRKTHSAPFADIGQVNEDDGRKGLNFKEAIRAKRPIRKPKTNWSGTKRTLKTSAMINDSPTKYKGSNTQPSNDSRPTSRTPSN